MSARPSGWPDPGGRIAAAIALVPAGAVVSHVAVAAAAGSSVEDAKATAVMLLLRGDLRCAFVATHRPCGVRLGPERRSADEAEADAGRAACSACGGATDGAVVSVIFYALGATSAPA